MRLDSGISDSRMGPAEACPVCGVAAFVGRGECLNCLLSTGLEADAGSDESLDAALAEIEIRDSDWRLGHYQILEEIGRGGMGVIYRARQRHSRRIVALKRVLSYHGDSSETLERFRREAEAAASLDHPNILPIYEVGEEDGLPFFTMKFATAGSLQQSAFALRDDPRECVRLLAKVTRAIAYAHGEGILHRDLKPGNILLDGRGEPMVSDFGLAKWVDANSDLTRSLAIFGTPGFIAPEQAKGARSELTVAADIYSLGAILFDLLAGRPPFLGEHALAVIHQAMEKVAPKLRSINPAIDRDLETICAKCLEREPAMRYRSASDLGEDLKRWLEGRPIVARPVSRPVSLWRWSRRNPLPAAAISACLALLMVLGFWQWRSTVMANRIRVEQMARRSLAVIPILDLDSAQPDLPLAEILAANLQSDLDRLGPSRVLAVVHGENGAVPQGSMSDVKEVGRASAVRAVLAGTTRLVGDERQFVFRLADAASGELLGTRSFTTKDQVTEQMLAHEVVEPINSILDSPDWSKLIQSSKDPGMRNESARELLRAGRELAFRMNVPDMDRAIGCYEKALALEPGSWIAHSYLAAAAGGRMHLAADARFLRRAESEARIALELAPESPEALRAFAGTLYQKGDLKAALEAQLRVLSFAPPDERTVCVLASILKALGRPDKALVWLKLARRWETRPGSSAASEADSWSDLGRDDFAANAYRRADDLQPEVSLGWVGICRLRLLKGDFAGAREIYRSHQQSYVEETYAKQIGAQIEFFSRNYPEAERLYEQLYQADPSGGGDFYGSVSYLSALGFLQKLRNDPASMTALQECREYLEPRLSEAPEDPSRLYQMAALESSLDHTEAALRHLEKAAAAGWLDYRSANLDPRFDAARKSARYTSIIAGMENRINQLKSEAQSVSASVVKKK